MSKINVLDQNTINQIAAGEVVERPASVVKELIENSIDANATAVTCEIKEGGISFIRITDNGGGIDKEDIPVAFLRHATSKIKSVEDLMTVGSLGFRGEALSSISSVAQVELVTKTRSSFIGARYVIEGGEEQGLSEIGCPDGTTFIIRNLFFNTPARRKFLKSATTEAGYISDLMERLAISHPEISFKFINNNKTILHTFGNRQLKDIIYHVYGRSVAAELVEIQKDTGRISLEGYVGKPIISRGNRNFENYFINGRYIKSGIISKAIEEAYRPYTMQHKYPFTALHFHVPSDLIDVNVHPTKMEIRFTNADEVYQMTYQSLKEALYQANMIPDVVLSEQEKETRKVQNSIPEPFETKRLAPSMKPLAGVAEVGRPASSYGNSSSSGKTSSPISGASSIVPRSGGQKISHSGQGVRVPSYAIGKPSFLEGAVPTLTKEESELFTKETELGKLREVIEHVHEAEIYKKNGNTDETENRKTTEACVARNDLDHAKESVTRENQEKAVESVTTETKNKVVDEITDIQQESFISEEEKKKNFQIIGQLFKTYWMVECDQQLYIIDQHAAHEKILYEATMKRLMAKEQCTAQMVSPPLIVTLSLKEEAVLAEHKETLEMLGFEIEPFGGKEYAVSSVPADMYGLSGESLFIEFLDELVQDVPRGTPDVILEKIASMSCKAAVKGNQRLSEAEARTLIEQLLTLENPFHCPHGRPIIVSMTKYELEKKFKRIV
ncbi:MAG: DNA mismatch repair endonuclease MutL [Clostridiales bacterium]|nr:DNA mismatch repair endonuclease MutL [Clostridiales bacterium]